MRILILASAVGRFGDGPTGGVSRYVATMARALRAADIESVVLVPEGSRTPDGMAREFVSGRFQASAATAERSAHPVPADSLLAAMLDRAYVERGGFDRIVNLNHDYLPVFVTGQFDGKLHHIPNLVSSDEATDRLIARRYSEYPARFAAMSRFQAAKLGLAGAPILRYGMETPPTRPDPPDDRRAPLFWSGRITPEKGLEAAAAVAEKAGRKLVVAGHVENRDYFKTVLEAHGEVVDYRGFVGLEELLNLHAETAAMLQTQSWEEALGVTTIEALAAGTPTIAFDRGANGEIVRDGLNGFLVAPGDVDAAARAVDRLSEIDGNRMRLDFEKRFSLAAFRARLFEWLNIPSRTTA